MASASVTDSLLAVDAAIESLTELPASASEDEIRNGFARFAQAALTARGYDVTDTNLADAFFDSSHTRADAHFLAICLLRALNARPSLLDELDCKRHAFRLFDEAFEAEIYPALGLESTAQTFEKERVLADAVRQVEADLTGCIANLTSLSELEGARKDISGRLSRGLPRALLRTFLERQLVEGRLQDIFRAAAEYKTAETASKIAAYEGACKAISAYEAEVQNCPAYYANSVLMPLAQTLRALIDADFLEDDVNKPVSVAVRPAAKRYPLDRAGSEVDLRLEVFTDGPGVAREVSVEIIEADGLQVHTPTRSLGDLRRESIEISFGARVVAPRKGASLLAVVTWRDGRGLEHHSDRVVQLKTQNPVDWERAAGLEPYSLEAVRTEDQLVGRRQLLDELIRAAQSPSPKSMFLFGQKRIGKTSIARALVSHCQQLEAQDVFAIFVDMSGVRSTDPVRTVRNLGEEIGEQFRRKYPRFAGIAIPECSESLRPLARSS